MYSNILAEMARKQLNNRKMAKLMQIPDALLEQKLSKKVSFTIKDIFSMQEIFNNKYCTFEYLLHEPLTFERNKKDFL